MLFMGLVLPVQCVYRLRPLCGSRARRTLVSRQRCCKGCEGRVLRSIQRFGRLGKRRRGVSPPRKEAAAAEAGARGAGAAPRRMKDPRCLYLAMDEACTHVGVGAFRLVAGIYDSRGSRLLATSVSPPIR